MHEPQIVSIPIARLNPIAHGVRKTNGISIDALAASIHAEGLLQNLTVVLDPDSPLAGAEEFQNYQVVAGSRRLRALRHLVQTKALPEDFEVPCRVIEEGQALSAGLAENAIREAMHPADEFTAFRQMIESGKSIEDVAARFGVTPLVVQRRLKLANVAPKLFELFRTDKITLAQMMALAISDDHKAQEKAWFKAEKDWLREPFHLRAALTQKEIDVLRDPVARFVGIAEYERAGGVVHKDLFSDKGAGYISDGALLRRLAAAKLEAAADAVRKEAWSWVDVRDNVDYAELNSHTRAQPSGQQKPTDVEKKRIKELTAERVRAEKRRQAIQDIDDGTDEDEFIEDEQLGERIEAIGDELQALENARNIWDPKILAQAGAIVTIDDDAIVIHRGLVKGKLKQAHGEKKQAAGEKAKPGHSESLIRDLTADVTFAIAAELVANPGMAVIAVTHRLALNVFYSASHFGDPIKISGERQIRFAKEAGEGSPDFAKLETERKAIQSLLPKKSDALLAWLLQKDSPVTRVLAYCVAVSVDAVVGNEKDRRAAPLAEALKLNMATRWTAGVENYLSRVSAAQILAAMTDAGAEKFEIVAAEKLKKAELIQKARPWLAKANWLPTFMRFGHSAKA